MRRGRKFSNGSYFSSSRKAYSKTTMNAVRLLRRRQHV